MSDITAPTCEQIFDEEGLKRVHNESDSSWRHGSYEYSVYHRESDNTYWGVSYRLSSDGETNELRDGDAEISQVEPKQVTVTQYVSIGKA